MTLKNSTLYTVYLLPIILILLHFSACKKSNVDEPIPNVPVNITIYLSLPQYAALNSVYNYALVDGGYKGIIVFRKSQTEFVAYDRACPYDPTVSEAKLDIDSSMVNTVDLHCGSKFNLSDGSILHGPSTRPMKMYNADFDSGNNTVYIYN